MKKNPTSFSTKITATIKEDYNKNVHSITIRRVFRDANERSAKLTWKKLLEIILRKIRPFRILFYFLMSPNSIFFKIMDKF